MLLKNELKFLFSKRNLLNFSAYNMPDTSLLITNEPFTNDDNINKLIFNFLYLVILLKRQ